jgi:O-antigen/teichoic acid export membrane protein
MKKDFQQVFDMIVSIMALATVCIVLFSGPTIRIMSSDESYYGAIDIIFPLTMSVFFLKMSFFFNLSFLVEKRTIKIAYLKYFSAFLMTIGYFTLIPLFGLEGAGYALLITNIFLFLSTYYWAKKSFYLGVNLSYCLLVIGLVMVCILPSIYWLSYDLLLNEILFKLAFFITFTITIGIALFKNKPTSSLVSFAIENIKERLVKS